MPRGVDGGVPAGDEGGVVGGGLEGSIFSFCAGQRAEVVV